MSGAKDENIARRTLYLLDIDPVRKSGFASTDGELAAASGMQLMLASKRVNGKGPWIAEITGTDSQYGLARRFLKGHQLAMVTVFTLEPGRVYDVAEPAMNQRRFVTFSRFDKQPRTIGHKEVMRMIGGGQIEDEWEPAVRYTQVLLEQYRAKVREIQEDLSDL